MTKDNDAWTKLFEKYDILKDVNSEGIYEITAKQINEYRQSRLMIKYDWSSSLPDLFRNNNLSILPLTRGKYAIDRFKAYEKLKYENMQTKVKKIPSWINTWGNFAVTSEVVALNIAKVTGMIDDIMRSDKDCPAVDTITGRLKSGELDFKIDRKGIDAYNIHVDNAQVEIDAGFGNGDSLAIIEAKTRIPDDFMIRQLYYPYRIYNNLGVAKPVLLFYFTYIDEIYTFYQYKFEDLCNYSSIKKLDNIHLF